MLAGVSIPAPVSESSSFGPFSAMFAGPVPAVFAVVGEHRADPDRLLLLGDDGRYYAYGTREEDVMLVELTPDWVVDSAA